MSIADKSGWKGFWVKWVLISLLGMGVLAFFYLDLGRFLTLEALKDNREALREYTEGHYGSTVLYFIAIYCIQTALSLPGATILTLAGGFIFGTWFGAIYVNIGATMGATLAFGVSRTLFREQIQRRFKEKLDSIQKGFEKDAFYYLLTLRLIPLFPFFLVNLASGLTRIRLSPYIIATSLGIIPGSLVYSNAGRQLGSIESLKDIASPGVLGAFLLLGLLALVPIGYKKWAGSNSSKTGMPLE